MCKKSLSFIPIGGVNEMGKNQMLIEIDDESFLVDNGLKHSCKKTPGVDFYIGKYKEIKKINPKFILITHGHLDHIGGIPFLLQDLPHIQIICTQFAKMLIVNLLEQYGNSKNPNFKLIKVGDVIDFETFKIKTFKMDHSVIESLGFICETKYGNFLHTGDFRLNLNNISESTDIKMLQEYGKKGMLCMFSDSTNAFRDGYTESEESVIGQIESIIKSRKTGKFIIATFSTQVERIKGIINLSKKLQKKILVDGRSMKNIFAICQKTGIFIDIDDILVEQQDIRGIKDNDLIILTTGTQGETRSGLRLFSTDKHRLVRVNKNDVILMSSSFIPGNEEDINDLINVFSEKEIEVITYKDFLIHVSGHAYRDELKRILDIVSPKYFVPIHGEPYSIYHHKNIAIESGIKKSNIFLLKNGDKFSIHEDSTVSIEKSFANIEVVYKDGNTFSSLGENFFQNRIKLEKNGVLLIFLSILRYDYSVVSLNIKTIGVSSKIDSHKDSITRKIYETVEKKTKSKKISYLEKNISEYIESYIFYNLKKSPVVVTSVLLLNSNEKFTFSKIENRSSSDS